MSHSPIEDNAGLMEQVAEALRAGPGTAPWEAALRGMGAAPSGVREEMELLARVRRDLAAGRGWREISAGPGFTTKLMTQIEAGDDEESERRSWAGWIAGFALLALVAIAGYAIYKATTDRAAVHKPAAEAEAVAFASPRVVWDFGMPWPARTSIQGALKLDATADGLRPAVAKVGETRLGGAALLEVPLEDGVIEATLEVPRKLAGDLVTQIFITTTTALDAQTAVSDGEWVLQLDRGGAKIVTGGLEVATPAAIRRSPEDVVLYRITLAGGHATVESSGETIWTGDLGLAAGKDRYVGVRYLARGDVPEAGVTTFKLLRLLGPR